MNRLAKAGSPYLLQHANNPVDWYPWGDEAFEKAAREGKPILLSIGYSACHWCHVMERESFENMDIAAVMNDFFVNIKLDREEHPEIDQLYMEAAQYLNGNAGWPLNCFLLPDRRPFYTGTYFPPTPAHGRPSWLQVLLNISKVWEQRREVVIEQAERLSKLVADENANNGSKITISSEISETVSIDLTSAFENISSQLDWQNGGFGSSPKFPMFNSIRFLLHYYYITGEETALEFAELSILKMCRGGIFDQLGGGIARYSTDDYWLVPHFEKMLYDNAQFLITACQLISIRPNSEIREAIDLTWRFLNEELKDLTGFYYAALDADSEGEEGKFYVWSKDSFDIICEEHAELVGKFLDISQEGNWEGTTILNRKLNHSEFANKNHLEYSDWISIWKKRRADLFEMRKLRIHPALDDKIILSWNALILSAKIQYARINPENQMYAEDALNFLDLLLGNFLQEDGSLRRVIMKGEPLHAGNLDDYAYVIKGILDLYQISQNNDLLSLAHKLLIKVDEEFASKESPFFFYTPQNNKEVFARKIDLFDNTIPSGNAVMASVFLDYGLLTTDTVFMDRARNMLKAIEREMIRYPSSYGEWLTQACRASVELYLIYPIKGEAHQQYLALKSLFLPNCLLSSKTGSLTLIEEEDKGVGKKGNDDGFYLCRQDACELPAADLNELLNRIMPPKGKN
jgi:uncharacterized protein